MRLALTALLAAAPLFAATHYVTVAGLGGETDYETRFVAMAKDIDKILRGSGSESQVHTLFGADATRAKIREIMARVAAEAKPDEAFVLTLIGHGSFDGTDYKLNIPGADVTAAELASLCDKIPSKRQLVVNMTSASGGSIGWLQKKDRVIISATKSGTEKNATVFARYWVEALRDAGADADKNEVITALEAFKFAEAKTKQFYETNKRIATEHPMLDGGDANGPVSAGRFALLRIGSVQKAANDPAKRALLTKREQLEGEIDTLKFQKAAMPTD